MDYQALEERLGRVLYCLVIGRQAGGRDVPQRSPFENHGHIPTFPPGLAAIPPSNIKGTVTKQAMPRGLQQPGFAP